MLAAGSATSNTNAWVTTVVTVSNATSAPTAAHARLPAAVQATACVGASGAPAALQCYLQRHLALAPIASR